MSAPDTPQADSDAPRRGPSAATHDPEVARALLGDLTGFGDFATRYEVEREIARGGMGAIYRVYDRKLRRRMAMKVMVGRGSSGSDAAHTLAEKEPRMLSRFLEEAQITGQIDHPGIVPVHEMGLDDEGRVFFTMKLVKGRDFRQVLELVHAGEDGWTLTRALGVILRVCESMSFAHTKGVLHRDLKPSNIMVGRFGETYVMDWGLAKVLGREDLHDVRLTLPETHSGQISLVESLRKKDQASDSQSPLSTLDGDVVGTPSYMAPEQALGLLDSIGPTSDVYSVGCLLYHLLTGHPPYVPSQGKVSAIVVLRMLIEGPPAPIASKTLPPELIAICHKALAREPHERYASMEALADDLRAFLEGRVVRAHQTGAVAEFRKWTSRNRGVAAGIGASVLLAVLGLAAVLFVQERSRRELRLSNEQLEDSREIAVANEIAARAAEERAISNAVEARRQSYVANLRAASASLRVHEVAEVARQLEACPEELRGWEWDLLVNRSDPSLRTLDEASRELAALAYGPRTGRLLGLGREGALYLWTPEGDLLAELDVGKRARCLAVRPDEERVAVGYADGLVRTFAPGSEDPETELDVGPGHVTALAYSADGAWLATGTSEEVARVLATADGEELWSEAFDVDAEGELGGQPVFGLAFTPDGRSLIIGHGQRVDWLRTRTWTPREESIRQLFSFTCMALDPDGKRLALGDQDGQVRLVSPRRATTWKTFEAHDDDVRALAFSPDGERLVSTSKDSTARVWGARTGDPISVLPGHRGEVLSAAYRPDGKGFATGGEDTAVRLWHDRFHGDAYHLAGDEWSMLRAVREAAFDADGGRLALALDVGAIRVLDVATEKLLFDAFVFAFADERPFGSFLHTVGFSPAGDLLGAAYGGRVVLWDGSTGVLLDAFEVPDETVRCVAFDPAGGRIAAGTAEGSVCLFDLATGRELWRVCLDAERVGQLVFAPDGSSLVAIALDRRVRMLDPGDGSLRRERAFGEGRGWVSRVAFDAAGERLAVAYDQYLVPGLLVGPKRVAIAVWDPLADAVLARMPGHEGGVEGLFFLREGDRLVSAGSDRTLRVWDPEVGLELCTLRKHEGEVRAAAAHPDGRRVLSVANEGEVLLWDARPLAERTAPPGSDPGEPLRDLGNIPVFFGMVEDLDPSLSDRDMKRGIGQATVLLWSMDPRLIVEQIWALLRVPLATDAYPERIGFAVRALGVLVEGAEDTTLLRGACAVRGGEPEEGVRLLLEGRAGDARERVLQQAFLALARAALGDAVQAQRSLDQAREALAAAGPEVEREMASLMREVEGAVGGS